VPPKFGPEEFSIRKQSPAAAESGPAVDPYPAFRAESPPAELPAAQRAARSATKYFIRARTSRWITWDAFVAFLSLTLGYALSPKADIFPGAPVQALLAYPFLAMAAGQVAGLYERQILLSGARLLSSAIVSGLLSVVFLVLFYNFVLFEPAGRWVLLITASCFFFGLSALRFLIHFLGRFYKIRVLIVGKNEGHNPVVRHLTMGDRHHVLAGFCNVHGKADHDRYVGHLDNLPALCRRYDIDEVLVSEEFLNESDVLEKCFGLLDMGVTVLDECSFFEQTFEQVPVERIKGAWFFNAKIGQQKSFDVFLKRLMDIVLSLVGILLLAPAAPLIWLAIRLTSPGPAIYTQIRAGQFGRPFRIYKFRTMRLDAEKNGPVWASERDPRITAVGQVLRKTRLDEIPQFWNVLKGDMSFVGPRPERPEQIHRIEQKVPYFGYRHWFRPGITGLAQVRYPYSASVEDAKTKLQHDLYYLKNFNILLDIQIIMRTAAAIMKGAR